MCPYPVRILRLPVFFEAQHFFDEDLTSIKFNKKPSKDLSEVLRSLQEEGVRHEHQLFERGEIVIQETPSSKPGMHHYKLHSIEDGISHVFEGDSRHDLPAVTTVVEVMAEKKGNELGILRSITTAFMMLSKKPPVKKTEERTF